MKNTRLPVMVFSRIIYPSIAHWTKVGCTAVCEEQKAELRPSPVHKMPDDVLSRKS